MKKKHILDLITKLTPDNINTTSEIIISKLNEKRLDRYNRYAIKKINNGYFVEINEESTVDSIFKLIDETWNDKSIAFQLKKNILEHGIELLMDQ